MDLSKIDNITFSYDPKDHPDYADAFIVTADYNGIPMDENKLDTLNEDHSEFVHEKLIELLF